MIKFKSLKMSNFMSYGAIPTTIQFDQPGTILLLGEDLDNTASGTGSNGVGKTSILNALVYALYDKPLSEDISKDGLVNHTNKSKMEVTIEFEKDGTDYVIVRRRKMKVGAAGNTTTLYENGVDITLGHNVDHTNAEIERILGVSYDIFCRIVAFSANQVPFLNLPVRHPTLTNQTDFIEELLELKILSEKAEMLKIQIKETDSSMKTHIEKNDAIKAEQERHNKQLDSARKRVVAWEQTHATEIEDVKHRIERLEKIDVEDQKTKFMRSEVLKKANKDYDVERRELKTELKNLETHYEVKTHELQHLNVGKCPRCNQTFKESNTNIALLEAKIRDHDREISKSKDKITQLDNIIDTNQIEITQLKPLIVVQSLEDLLETKNKIEQAKKKLIELEAAQNPHNDVLNELNAVQLEQIDMSKINELKSTLDHQNFLLKLLTKKDSFVRKALINKHIPFLNQRLKKYLIDLGLPHIVEFTHEMTAKITKFGHEMEFGNLSNGQRARVNLALSFAFRDVLQSMHDSVNICMLDEVLDVGLDTIGVQAAVRMLKRKARDEKLALYTISHRDEIDSAFDRKMIVQMSEGFSSIRYEDG